MPYYFNHVNPQETVRPSKIYSSESEIQNLTYKFIGSVICSFASLSTGMKIISDQMLRREKNTVKIRPCLKKTSQIKLLKKKK